jgi:tetratricopeptide (TPR) repeat protein
LNEQLVRLASACAPAPVTIVALCYDPEISRHLRTLLEATLAAFGDLSNSVIVAEDTGPVVDLAADVEATPVEMPLHQFCSGLNSTFASTSQADARTASLPSSSGAPLLIPPKDQRWLEEEVEIVTLESGQAPPVDRTIGRDFLQGNEISWYELGIHSDVERDITSKAHRQIRNDLESRKTARINLYHAPGAGGTTVAKRLVWDSHREHPCVMLRTTNPPETADRVAYVTSYTGISVLVAIDGADIAERQVDELYDQLRARNVPAVILQVVRRFTTPTEGPRSFLLREELSGSEGYKFKSIFEREQPGSSAELDRLMRQADSRFRTAFYFGLVAFKEDFRGLEPYVTARIGSLTQVQKRILGFAAVAHHYGQKPLPAQAFAEILSIPRSRSLDLNSVFPVSALELLIRLEEGRWRTAHNLIAVEILKQLLWPSSSDRRLWKQNLSQWARDFAEFCRGSGAVPSEELLEVVRRVFVYRDNSELLGTERAGLNQFSQLIDDIPSKEGALEVLRSLTELYPDEAHFWAHLGRFHSVQRRDFPSAVECIDRAIALQDKDNVLHHMRGMALRQQVYDNIDKEQPLARIVELANDASSSFGSARELSPDDEHGYISEVQMLLRMLDYAGRKLEGGTLSYVASPNAEPFLREAFQRAEDLLEHVRRNREGEGASPYEETCRARLDLLYGKHDRALQTWDNLLTRKGTYAPPIRRQLVWTYLARQQRSWYGLEAKEIDRIVELLEQNLREEPQLDTNLRLWVQAVRRAKNAPTTEAVIERVGYWRSNANSLDSVFYLYVFYTLQSIEGSALALDQASRFIEECRNRTRFNRNRTKSLEWLGKGSGVTRLVHHSQLGNWDRSKDFWENTSLLERALGRIARIVAPQSGEIEVKGGLKAFFVPARGNYSRGRSENRAVAFYLGFSYEGLRAWEVKDA